jgi:ABC-type uncharacterized transport system ATPase subunit
MQELHITQDCDSQGVLTEVMSRTRVKSFEIASPSLHDIFVRIAGPEAKELVFDPNKKFVENEEVRYA